MNDEHFDNILRSALMDAAKADYEDIWENTGCEVPSFSKDYLRKRKALMRDPFKKKKKKPISILKRVAAAVLFVTLIAGSLILIPEVEAGLFKIFTDEYDDHSTITFSDENTPNIGRWYPEYIPDGFEETFYDDTFDNVVIIFENNEDRIVFQYVPASQGASMTFNSEHATPHDIKIQDFEATVYVTNDAKHQNYVVWSSEDQTTAFILFSRIDYTELIKIAKSISLVESE